MDSLLASLLINDLWYALPLVIVVSLVYAATRHEAMPPILLHACGLAGGSRLHGRRSWSCWHRGPFWRGLSLRNHLRTTLPFGQSFSHQVVEGVREEKGKWERKKVDVC